MVVHVLRETLEDIRPRETVVLYLFHYLLINLQVVIVLIESVVHISFLRFTAFADKVLVKDLIGPDDFLFEILWRLLLGGGFALIVSVLVVDAIIKVLVVRFLVLAVELADSRVEPNDHVLVNYQALHLLIYRLRLSACLGIERTQYHRPT